MRGGKRVKSGAVLAGGVAIRFARLHLVTDSEYKGQRVGAPGPRSAPITLYTEKILILLGKNTDFTCMKDGDSVTVFKERM